ncbi:MAG: OmpA family protein [Bacteroidota bacterium]
MSELYRYPGVKPFSPTESRVFFGRTQDIQKLSRFIRLEDLVVLHGKSGLGKTSMIQAGMMPLMQEDASKEEYYEPLPIRFRSYTPQHPRFLMDVFSENIPRTTSFLDELPTKHLTLWQVLKSRQLSDGEQAPGGYLLVLDQFEELFTYPEAEVEMFGRELATLYNRRIPNEASKVWRRELIVNKALAEKMKAPGMKELVESPVNVKILIAIRSDRFNLLDRFSDYLPEVKINSLILEPFSRTQAKEALIEPARVQGKFASPPFTISAKAETDILDFLTANNTKRVEGFQLQIIARNVEEKLMEFLDHPEDPPADEDQIVFEMIPEADVPEHAEVKEIRGNFGNILRRYYDEQIQKLEEPGIIRTARVLIEEDLIAEERRISLDRAALREEVTDELLEKLVTTRIIRREPNNLGGFSFEVSHDTLIEPILEAKAERGAKEDRERLWQEAKAAQLQRLEEEQKEQKARFNRRFVSTLVVALVLISGLTVILYQFWQVEGKQGDVLETKNEALESQRKALGMLTDTLQEQQNILKGVFGVSDAEWDTLIRSWQNKSDAEVKAEIAKYDYTLIEKELEEMLSGYQVRSKVFKEFDKLHIRMHVYDQNVLPLSGGRLQMVESVGRILAKPDYRLYAVLVEVHTDDSGDDFANLSISATRATEIAENLRLQGVNATRITVKGVGESQPVLPTSNRRNRAENRRVEIVLTVPKEME